MKLNFEKMMYVKVLMMVIAIWFVPMTYSNGAEAPAGDVAEAPGTDTFNNDWYDARATFYGDIHGGDTQSKFSITNTIKLMIYPKIMEKMTSKSNHFINNSIDYLKYYDT